MYLELNRIKKHLNIDDQFTDDDEYILQLSEVAEEIVQKHIDNQDLDTLLGSDGSLPQPLLQAMLLMVGNLYSNRESVSYANAYEIPFAYDYLLALYKEFK